MIDLELLLMFYGHYAVEFLCEQAHLERHRLHPCLHQQTGPNTLRFWIDMCIVRVSCCIDWPLTIPLDDRTFGY
ncbi:hypothetical protein FWK35_00030558, partial [Aphis craccivora]